jgi:hypothetical protein
VCHTINPNSKTSGLFKHPLPYCYLLPSLYAVAFVRRTTSSTDLHPLLKRILYYLRFYHIIFYTGCGTFLKRVCHNTRTLLSYLHFYARTCKSIYRLITKTHPSMHIIVVKSKTHPSMHIIVLKSKTNRCGKIKTHRFGKIQDIKK